MTPPPPASSASTSGRIGPLSDDGFSSRYFFSDREIGKKRYSPILYDSSDFKTELVRVERRLYRLSIVSLGHVPKVV